MRDHALAKVIFVCLAVLGTGVPAAATDMFLYVDGVQGESLDSEHEDWIDILSFSHGVSRPGCTDPLDHSEYVVTKYVDRATDNLYDLVDRRETVSEVRVEFAQSGGDKLVYYVYEFQNVIFNLGAATAATGDFRPFETWSFSYSQVRIKYRPEDPAGGAGPWEEVVMTVGPCDPS